MRVNDPPEDLVVVVRLERETEEVGRIDLCLLTPDMQNQARYDNPRFNELYRKMSKMENTPERKAILREMRIGHVSDTMGYALSGGERRRVEIARALVISPDFLLLDEPFAGIDPISVADLQQVILGLKERGIGVIMTDHNVRDTLKVCDRAYIISEGEILLAGKPGEIAASDRVREIYLGDDFSL